ncbi:MAG: glycosyltransferase family 39 protein [Acidimicrobiales bacterium]|nr:glycosyltransferase family 39 protein [Acidimicrobiales bacterium]
MIDRREPSRLVTAIGLGLILLVGGWFRLTGIDFDRGAHLHPDERFLAIVASAISAPDGPRDYFDTEHTDLNPANHDLQTVYGTAPIFAGKGLAAWLHGGAAEGRQPARTVVVALDHAGLDLLDDDGAPTFDAGYEVVLVGRFLSAVLDLGTVLVAFELGRVLRGRATGLASAFAYACCVLAVQQAHFFVVDPMLTFATALALLAAVHVARGRGRWTLAAGGVAAGVAGASKVGGLSVLAVLVAATAVASAEGLGAALRRRTPWRVRARALAPFVARSAIAVGAAAVTFRILQPYAFVGVVRLDPRWTRILDDLARLQDGADAPPNIQWADRVPVLEALGHQVRFGVGIGATLLAVAGLAAIVRRGTWRREPALALIAAWVALTGAIFLPRWVITMRYLLPALPAVAVLAGVGAVGLLRRPGAPRAVGGVLVLATLLWPLAFVHGVYQRTQPRLAAAAWVEAHVPDGAAVSASAWDDALPLEAGTVARGVRTITLDPFALTTPDDARRLADQLDQLDYVVETSDRVTGAVARVPARYGTILRYYRGLDDGSLGFERVATFRTAPSLFGIELNDRGSEEAFRVYDHPEVRIWRKTDAFSLERALEVIQPDRARTDERVPLRQASANGLLLERDEDAPATGQTFADAFPGRLPVPWLWWLAWWMLSAAASLPWVLRCFRVLPDRGWGLAKVLGPLSVLVPLWLLVALGAVRSSGTAVGVASGVQVAVGAALLAARGGARWHELVAFVRERRRTLVALEVAGLAVFLAVLALRAANPDLWYHPTGGEKPFAAAYLTALARSSTFPPADPWFSGGAMNYYYGTWWTIAAPARLLGIAPDLALNLAVATAASLLASVVWSIGLAVAALGRVRARARAAWGGLLALVLVLGVGNLDSARQQIGRLDDALAGRTVAPFDWWGVSRLNPGTIDIDEFPAWTVLFGDPHPHLLWAPVLLALVATLVAYVATRRAGDRRAALALAAIVGTGLAWSRVSHTWDLPTLAVLALAAAAGGAAVDRDARPWRRSLGHLALIGGLTVVVAHPYVAHGQVFDSGFAPSPARTPLGSFLLQLGLPLAIVVVAAERRVRRRARAGALPGVLASRRGRAGVAAMALGALLLLTLAGGPVLALGSAVAAVALAIAVADLRAGRLGLAAAWALAAAGAGLAVVPEVVVVVNDLGRMNTVFKFGFTAWSLLALGAAGLAIDLVAGARRPRRAAIVLGLALVPALAFWPSATGPRLDARFRPLAPTLDGRAWLDHGPVVVAAGEVPPIDVTADRQLIAWMRDEVPGGSTIVEAAGPSYSWVARVSVATGLPTVVGWQFHQQQQRRGYVEEVDERFAAVQALYADPEPEQAMRTLAAYRPDYVVVGTVERALGTPDALAGLGALPGMTEAWRRGDEVVYRLDARQLDRALAVIDAERIRAGRAS